MLCSLTGTGESVCHHDVDTLPEEEWTWCGSNLDAWGNRRFGGTYDRDNFFAFVNYDYENFDNFGNAVLAVLITLTISNWSYTLYEVIDTVGPVGSCIYFLCVILFGSFFVLKLLVIILQNNYSLHVSKSRFKPSEGQDSVMEYAGRSIKRLFACLTYGRGRGNRVVVVHYSPDDDGSGFDGEENDSKVHDRIRDHVVEETSDADDGRRADSYIDNKAPGTHDRSEGVGSSPMSNDAMCGNTLWLAWADSWEYEVAVALLVIINTIVLCCDYYPIDPNVANTTEAINFIITLLFALDMALKLAHLKVHGYISDSFHRLDGVVVIASMAELCLAPPPSLFSHDSNVDVASNSISNALTSLRLLRLFRVLRLFRLPMFHRLLEKIVHSLVAVEAFLVLL